MSFVYSLIAVGVLVLLLFGAPAVMRILPRGGAVAAGSWRTVGMVLGGLVAGIVLITFSTKSTMGWEFWAIFVGLVAAAVIFHGTAPGKWAAGFVVVFLIGYGIFHAIYGKEASRVAEANQQEIAKATLASSAPGEHVQLPSQPGKVGVPTVAIATPVVTVVEPKWEKALQNGSLPIGEWSQTLKIGVGCRTNYDAGNGTDFKIRYSFYSPEWTIHPGGDNYPPANELQFMVLKPRTEVPVKVTCN